MKVILLSLGIIIINNSLFAQNEAGLTFGSMKLHQLENNIEVQSSFSSGFYIKKDFNVTKRFYVEPWLIFTSATVFTDGHFSNVAGNPVFTQTPTNFKQSRINMNSFAIPVIFKYSIFSNADAQGISIGVGPYVDYLTNVRQLYKIETTKHKENAPIDNKINGGLMLDFGTSGNGKKVNRLAFGGGLRYQFTKYLDGGNSFKPLNFYLRFGYTF